MLEVQHRLIRNLNKNKRIRIKNYNCQGKFLVFPKLVSFGADGRPSSNSIQT